ncbi:hypothetical protein AVEN_232730-1 [Araneus ventricosus]|uniref:RNase H type-1 domain-containing protein n=1 Tax=Araneus ventricosus TaxID=182803 RepID=A0A4Y2HGS9_ARAVE|nr:hypothetical protein AVEN_232730-1 [Araneus ventricosus]
MPPLHLTAKAEFQKFQAWACRSAELGRLLDINNLDYYINLTDVSIELRTLDIIPKVLNNQYEVYTDGSRIEEDTGFSVCILKNGEPFKIFQFKLNKNNTVFQAELAAIDFAMCWALENGVRINIHIDSPSSIKAMRNSRSRSATVNKVKKNCYLSEGSVGLTWVKAHAGDPGNELTDRHAKLATAEGEKLEIPAPYSSVKFIIEKNLLSDWQETWDDYDFESGRRTWDFVPKVYRKFLVFSKYLIFFLSGHGPFPYYLNRFKKLNSSSCPFPLEMLTTMCSGANTPKISI